MKVYIGYDKDEIPAYEVAQDTLYKTSGVRGEALEVDRLRRTGLFTRPVDSRGQKFDFHSEAPCSTDFAITRFLVPIICQSGWALFTDCDVVFYEDVINMMAHTNPKYAVMVVKHGPHGGGKKMGGMEQTTYNRKNWSSVVLFNCSHPAHERLSLYDINHRPGRDLHQFYWLHTDEIGALPPKWNWLVNVEPQPKEVGIAHFTQGGPWIKGWRKAKHDELWLKAKNGGSS